MFNNVSIMIILTFYIKEEELKSISMNYLYEYDYSFGECRIETKSSDLYPHVPFSCITNSLASHNMLNNNITNQLYDCVIV